MNRSSILAALFLLGSLLTGCHSAATRPPDIEITTSPEEPGDDAPSVTGMTEIATQDKQPATDGTDNLAHESDAVAKQASTPTDQSSHIELLSLTTAQQTGKLRSNELNEISGMSASLSFPGVLYLINDSGNLPRLYAIDEQGQLLATWDIAARNRDWEDMARMSYAGSNYLLIGDTGDNLRLHRCATLHFILEPVIPAQQTKLSPSNSIDICFDDGPRNVEAFAVADNTLYLLSKEPLSSGVRTPSGVYRVDLPEGVAVESASTEFIAERIAEMPLRSTGLEWSLAAALAGVDLSQPTSMEFNMASNSAYILTYREVLRIRKNREQSWADAFSEPATRVQSHHLRQAEALTISPGRAIWFTSEKPGAPLWAVPLTPPL